MLEGSRAQSRVFISYRRTESAYAVGWLVERLAARFGPGQVFKDVDSIEPGDDFVAVLDGAIRSCAMVLVVIGPGWASVTDAAGRRRLDDPADFVAREVEMALSRDVRLVPVLVDGAAMPDRSKLPDRLANLATRQALELRPDRFVADTERLVELVERVLGGADAPLPPAEPPQALAAVIDTLVLPPPVLVGRDAELAQLRAALVGGDHPPAPPATIIALHGMGGVGKTALARAFAAEVAKRYGDGRFEVDLAGFTPGATRRGPGEVLGDLLSLAGFSSAEMPGTVEGRSAQWRSWLAERRVLLVVDNARDAADVIPLLPGGRVAGRCLVLVTSRRRMPELATALDLEIGALKADAAVALLVAAGRRPVSDLTGTGADLAAVAKTCGYLPLALRTAGTLLIHLEPSELAQIMVESQHPFDHLPDVEQAAAGAFTVSYDALTRPLQEALLACARHPGPDFDARSAAALANRPPALMAVQLAGLADANMLAARPDRRYTFHDLHRDYARRQADRDGGKGATREARYRLYAQLQDRLDAAAAAVYPDNSRVVAAGAEADRPAVEEARRWLTVAAGELIAATGAALADGWSGALGLGDALAYWLHAGGRSDEAQTLAGSVLAAAHAAGNLAAEARSLAGIGLYCHAVGDPVAARAAYEEAVERYDRAGDPPGQASALKGLGDVARVLDDLATAEDCYRRAGDRYTVAGDDRGRVDALSALADTALARGDDLAADASYQAAHDLAVAVGYGNGEADALCGLGDVANRANHPTRARSSFERAREIYRRTSNRHGLAYALKGLGDTARLQGDWTEAGDGYRRALALYEQIGFRHCEAEVLVGLGDVARAEGRPDGAADRYRQAIALCEDIQHVSGQIDALSHLANLVEPTGPGDAAALRARADDLRRLQPRRGDSDGPPPTTLAGPGDEPRG